MPTPSLSSIIAKDTAGEFASDADFDDALWLALCDQVTSTADLAGSVGSSRRMSYRIPRYVEWEVGNGRFCPGGP